MACPFGWQSAPPGVEYSARCYKSVSWATSLRECVENCGLGAAPVCPKSAEEAALVTGIFTDEAELKGLKEVKKELKGLKEGVRALLQAQGIPAERLPLFVDEIAE